MTIKRIYLRVQRNNKNDLIHIQYYYIHIKENINIIKPVEPKKALTLLLETLFFIFKICF